MKVAAALMLLVLTSTVVAEWNYEIVDQIEYNVLDGFYSIYSAIDRSDRFHLVYSGGWFTDFYSRKDPNGWFTQYSPGSGKIVLDTVKSPHFCYVSGGDLNYVYYDYDGWKKSVIASHYPFDVIFADLVLDRNNNPHVLYCFENDNNNYGGLNYKYYNGTEWVTETIEDGIYYTHPRYCSIILDSNSNPYISYDVQSHLEFAKRQNNEWQKEIAFQEYGTSISTNVLSQDALGRIMILFYDENNHKVNLAEKINDQWNYQIIDDAYPESISMKIDNTGVNHILYEYGDNEIKNIKYANNYNGQWHFENIIQGESSNMINADLTLDNGSNPNIFFVFTIDDNSYLIRSWKNNQNPTPTPPPTPTPNSQDGSVDLELSRSYYRIGDLFILTARLQRGNSSQEYVPFSVVLDCYGAYYFWPEWKNTFDFRYVALPAEGAYFAVIEPFNWPYLENQSNQNLYFYGAMFSNDIKSIRGTWDSEGFGYGL